MEGCKCPSCWGFAEYMRQLTGKDYGLPAAPGHAPEPDETSPPCQGGYVCPCPKCRAEVAERLQQAA